jgi:hypothetical protein
MTKVIRVASPISTEWESSEIFESQEGCYSFRLGISYVQGVTDGCCFKLMWSQDGLGWFRYTRPGANPQDHLAGIWRVDSSITTFKEWPFLMPFNRIDVKALGRPGGSLSLLVGYRKLDS